MSACPECGGTVAVVLARAWCIKPYADGGCGAFYQRRGQRWVSVHICGPVCRHGGS
jgi:hypothetical protein